MAVYRSALIVMLTLALAAAAVPEDTSRNEQARQLFESLFTPPGQLPVQDLVAEGEELDAEGAAGHLIQTARTKYFFKAPNMLRFDRLGTNPKKPFQNQLHVTIRDGDSYYIFVGHNYPSKTGVDPQIAPDSLPFCLTRYKKDASREFYYLGSEAWKDITVHRIQILNPADPGWTAVCWIDSQKRVPVQAEYTVVAAKGAKPGKKRVVWSDVRQLPDGRYFPYQVQIFEDEKLTSMRVYKGVRINVGLDGSLFRPIPELEQNR
jgi:outer membrane lipoprotein-sorting protein